MSIGLPAGTKGRWLQGYVRSLEITGEAAKRVPDAVRSELSHLEWRKMAGMRDRLIHDYGGVDYAIVWDAAVAKAGALAAELRAILPPEP